MKKLQVQWSIPFLDVTIVYKATWQSSRRVSGAILSGDQQDVTTPAGLEEAYGYHAAIIQSEDMIDSAQSQPIHAYLFKVEE